MPALAGTHNIVADFACTFSREFIKKDSKRRVVPLTNYTARMEVRNPDTGAVLMSMTTENGRIAIDAPRGLVAVTVSDDAMSNLPVGKYKYDLEIVGPTPDFVVERLVKGSFTVKDE